MFPYKTTTDCVNTCIKYYFSYITSKSGYPQDTWTLLSKTLFPLQIGILYQGDCVVSED